MLQAIITYTPNHSKLVRDTFTHSSKDALWDSIATKLNALEQMNLDNMEIRISIKPVRECAYI